MNVSSSSDAVAEYIATVERNDLACCELKVLITSESDPGKRRDLVIRLKSRRRLLLRDDQEYARLRAAAYDAAMA